MIRFILSLSLVHFVLCSHVSLAADALPPTVRVLVPAYFYPAGEGMETWKVLLRSAAKVPIVAIVNPGSGPGKRVDSNYTEVFELAKNTRTTLIGYVTLSYAKRPLPEIKSEIDSWQRFYPGIQGIFFDEQPSSAEHAEFATECFAYARDKISKSVIISNPGVVCAEEYLKSPANPTVCMFEHYQGFDKYRLPTWADAMKPDRFAILHYGIETPDTMRTILQAAIQQRAGYVFLTDRKGPMPWDKLPSYWQTELDEIAKFNQTFFVPDNVNEKSK